jgi:hypothetical protein
MPLRGQPPGLEGERDVTRVVPDGLGVTGPEHLVTEFVPMSACPSPTGGTNTPEDRRALYRASGCSLRSSVEATADADARVDEHLPASATSSVPMAFGKSAPDTSGRAGPGTAWSSVRSQTPQPAGSSAPSSPGEGFHTDRSATSHTQHSVLRGPPAQPWDAIATWAPARARRCSRPEDRRARTAGHRVWREPGRSRW